MARLLFIVLAMTLGTATVADTVGPYAFVSSHGLDIHYRQAGTGEPLLIIGGGPGDASDRYLSLCELLAPKYRCILVDQRGTGKSTPAVKNETTVTVAQTVDDFEAIRVQLGLKQWTVLGFSYGGFLASVYGESFPASIKSVVLLDSSGLNNDYGAYFGDNITSRMTPEDRWVYDYWSDPARLQADRHHAITEIIRSMMPGYFFDRKKSVLVSQAIRDTDFDFETGDLIEQDIARRKLDLATTESVLDKPVLILHGRQDPLGESIPRTLAQHYGRSTLVFVEQAGHYSWIEQPEKVLAAIDSFLQSAANDGRRD